MTGRGIKHRASNTGHQAPGIKHRASSTGHRAGLSLNAESRDELAHPCCDFLPISFADVLVCSKRITPTVGPTLAKAIKLLTGLLIDRAAIAMRLNWQG